MRDVRYGSSCDSHATLANSRRGAKPADRGLGELVEVMVGSEYVVGQVHLETLSPHDPTAPNLPLGVIVIAEQSVTWPPRVNHAPCGPRVSLVQARRIAVRFSFWRFEL